MITIHSGDVTIQIEGSAKLLIDDEMIILEDGSEATIASNGDGGGLTFEHAETDDHELIFWEAAEAAGLDIDDAQPDNREIEIHVAGEGLLYRAYRRWEEGWGVGTEAVLGGPAAAPAGTYKITALTTSTS